MSFLVANTTADIIDEALYDSLHHVFMDMGIDAEIVFSNDNGLEPKNTYCVIQVLNRERFGRQDSSTFLTRDTSEMFWTDHYTILVQLSFLGKNASNLAWAIDEVIPSSTKYREEFQRNTLGFMNKSSLRRAPQPRETRWVDGYNLDLTFSFAIQYRQEMDWVEFITINGEKIRIYPKEYEIRTVENGDDRTVETGEVREVDVS